MMYRRLAVLIAAAALASSVGIAQPDSANAIGPTDTNCIPYYAPPDCE